MDLVVLKALRIVAQCSATLASIAATPPVVRRL